MTKCEQDLYDALIADMAAVMAKHNAIVFVSVDGEIVLDVRSTGDYMWCGGISAEGIEV